VPMKWMFGRFVTVMAKAPILLSVAGPWAAPRGSRGVGAARGVGSVRGHGKPLLRSPRGGGAQSSRPSSTSSRTPSAWGARAVAEQQVLTRWEMIACSLMSLNRVESLGRYSLGAKGPDRKSVVEVRRGEV